MIININKTDPAKVYHRTELLRFLLKFYKPKTDEEGRPQRLMVGMVGYPNVGKSSSINVLVGEKRVAMSSTPGKTKHFQTIPIGEKIMLCDCPGLVFPTFASTKADMTCNGLLPIDNLKEHRGPVTLVCQRIPREVLEEFYGIVMAKPGPEEDPNRNPTSEELLQAHAFIRGFMTVHGSPNESVSARFVLKDYVNGKLLYVYPPPGVDSLEFNKLNPPWLEAYETRARRLQDPVHTQQQAGIGAGSDEDGEDEDNEDGSDDEQPGTTSTNDSNVHPSKSKKKKQLKKRLQPTIRNPETTEEFFAKQDGVVAHARKGGRNKKQERQPQAAGAGFTRAKFQHSPIPVAQLQAIMQQQRLSKKSTTQQQQQQQQQQQTQQQ